MTDTRTDAELTECARFSTQEWERDVATCELSRRLTEAREEVSELQSAGSAEAHRIITAYGNPLMSHLATLTAALADRERLRELAEPASLLLSKTMNDEFVLVPREVLEASGWDTHSVADLKVMLLREDGDTK